MLRPVLLLCSKGISRDTDEDDVSIFNLIEGVRSQGFPTLIQTFCVFLVLAKDEADPAIVPLEVRMSLNGAQLFVTPIQIDFQDKQRSRSIIKITGVILPGPGTMTVAIARVGDEGPPVAVYEIPIVGPAPQAQVQPG